MLETKDTKKNPRPRSRDSPSEDRPSRGQRLECSRPRTEDNRRKCSQKKKVFKKIFASVELRSRGFYVQAFADDLAVLVTGADMLWIRGMGMAQYWASEQDLQISSKKTEIVQFTHKRNPDLGSLSINGSKLELSQEARLLGVTLNSKLTWKPHINRITRKATTALMQRGKLWVKRGE